MQKLLRRRIPNWLILAIGMFMVIFALSVSALNKPLPEYLIAAEDLVPGEPISADSLMAASFNLGASANLYLRQGEALKDATVLSLIRQGELIPKAGLTRYLTRDFTSLRFVPELKPSKEMKPGSWVSIWQVIETEDAFESQRLISRALVLGVITEDGLFAGNSPEVEISLQLEDSSLLLSALTAGNDVYLLPVP
ncbi:MAG: SAF domain-containing protein [Aquiluna sp.]|nr:SAF domain-containing protein [Aquiluna sp.]MCF8546282.1 SAF domain-containing protein [Aquiluna sp.]